MNDIPEVAGSSPAAPTITLDEWISLEIARLTRFKGRWRRGTKEEPEMYPLELPAGEWDDQYLCFDDKE